MKKIWLVFIATTFIGTIANAQTADELINKYVEARGGADKVKAMQTMVMEGSMNQGGVDVNMKYTSVHNKGTRVDFTAMGQSGYNIITTTEGWAFNPFGGGSVEPIEGDQLKDAQAGLDIQGGLFDYKAKGNTVEYKGKETVEGKECYKLKLTRSSGKSVTYYLTSDYLLYRSVSLNTTDNGEVEVITEYSDYRKLPNGYTLPFARKSGANEITFDKIEINVPVDEKVFKPNN